MFLKVIFRHNNNFTFIRTETVTNYLERLNFTYSFDNSKLIWKVDIPYLRSEDITREIDLIEEIGRLHGFNNFLTRLPKIKTIGIEDYSYQTRKRITSCLLNLGFTELIHYSLVNQTTFLNTYLYQNQLQQDQYTIYIYIFCQLIPISLLGIIND